MRFNPFKSGGILCALMTLFFNFTISTAHAQPKPSSIKGIVLGEKSAPLTGVSVVLRNTRTNFTSGTSSDSAGVFLFTKIPAGGPYSFTFSAVGYETQTLSGYNIKEDITLSLVVNLKPTAATVLDQIVVVGYGSQKRKDLTGAVGSVSSKDIKDMSVARVDQALAGKAAGVQVKPVSGQPGAAPQIRVRGIGSISAGADPLYVVDGFPVDDIQTLNPNDVENVDILKDASASAIYGSRGSNGVILITTKRGKEGRPVVSYDGYYGMQKVLMKPKMMNAQEEARYFYDGVKNRNLDAGNDVSGPANTWKLAVPPIILDVLEGRNTTDVDWLDEIMHTAPMQQHQITLRGGSREVKYSISGEYLDQDGIIRNTHFVRYSVRANMDATVSKRLTLRLNVNPSFTQENIIQAAGLTSGPNENVIGSAMAVTPFYPIYDSTGDYYSYNGLAASGNFYHPLALVNEIQHPRKGFRVISNIISEYRILNELKFNILLGVNLQNADEAKFRPKLPAFLNDVAYGSDLTSNDYNWLSEFTLNYNKSFGNHNFAALAGYTAQRDRFSTNYIYSDKFPNNLVPTLSAVGNQITAGTSTVSEWSMLSYLARLNYNYNDKYYLTASFRTDGSSRFGSERKYGKFPSAAVAWRISEEKFLKDIKNLDELKLRVSYGQTGNNNIGNYAHLATINYENYALGGVAASGYAPGNLANPILTWEKQEQVDFGLNIGIYKRRVNLSVDYFRSRNTDLLLNVNIPDITGFRTSLQNIGEVRNRGWEFVLSTVNLKGLVTWSTDLNFSTFRNKVTKLGPSGDPIISGGNITMIGQPIGMFYGWLTNGVFKNQAELDAGPIFAPGTASRSHLGDTRFVDISGPDGKPDGIINSLDKTIMGNPYPDFYYGMTNRVDYKNFSFVVSLQGSKGAQILNMTRLGANMSTRARTNQLALSNNYWKSPEEPGDENTPRPNDAPTGNIRGESQQKQLDTGSYMRINNMTLSYNFGEIKKVKVSAFRVYLNAINPFIITKNTSFNPESSNSPDALTPGRDLNDYPLAKSLSLGVNLSF